MNARHVVKMSVFALLLSPALVLAQGLKDDQTLPDLVPADLAVDKVCAIVVTIRNDGPAIVPDAGYSLSRPGSSGVQIYKGGAPWGVIVLGGLDRSHLSQLVGGRVSYTFPGLALTGGTHEVRVDVDINNSIAESNELNNSLTKTLTCQLPPPALPDLVPTDISLQSTSPAVNSPCRIILTLRNIGTGIVPDAAYVEDPQSPYVVMYKGGGGSGAVLNIIDRQKVLQPPGATFTNAWMGGAAESLWVPPGDHTLRVEVDNTNALVESNEANNSLTKTLTCGFVIEGVTTNPVLPDLVPTNISLEPTGPAVNSPCQIVITLKNNGPGSVPDAAFAQTAPTPTIQMYKGGAGWGGAALVTIDPAKVLQPAGATLVYPWMAPVATLKVGPGEHVLRVDVDNFNSLVESNEANNSLTKTLTCGIIIAPPTTSP
jgi:CARDB protein